MSRWLPALLALGAASLAAQNSGNPQTPPDSPPAQLKTVHPQPATSDKQEVPPEEDSSLATTAYSFNPLQSKKDVLAGKFYAKKGNYALRRPLPGGHQVDESNSEAWLLLGEADQRLKDKNAPETHTRSTWSWRRTPRTPPTSARNSKS